MGAPLDWEVRHVPSRRQYPRKRVDTTSVDVKASLANSLVRGVCGQSLGVIVGPIWVAVVGLAGCIENSRVGCGDALTALSSLDERGAGKKSASSGLRRQGA